PASGAAPGALRERRGSGRAARSEASIAAATLGAPVVAPAPEPAGDAAAVALPAPTDRQPLDLVPDLETVPDLAPEASGTATPWWAGDDGAAAADPVPDLPDLVGGAGAPGVPGLEPVDDEPFVLTPADVPTPAVADVPMIRVGTHQPGDDDHDGMTILSSDLAQIRDQLPTWSQDAVPGPFLAPVPAPLSARLVLSTGLVVPLDRSVLLGRAPQVARVTNRELPRLVTVPSPNQDISRTHAEVRVDGEHVVVTDLDSTNGVHVSRAGDGVRRLHPGEPSVVATDEVVDLGDGVTFTVERTT
ncbi:FHA domain-containing protein, partial [Cellulomonas oligotrophica]